MASSDLPPMKPAHDIIDLTGDSDEDDSCILLEYPLSTHSMIKIEPEEEKSSTAPTSDTAGPSTGPPIDLTVLDTTQKIDQVLEPTSDEPAIASTIPNSSPSPSTTKIADSEVQKPVTDSTPTDSTPTDSTPTDSTPTDSTPTDSTPTDSTPTDSTPTDSTPTDSTPTDAAVESGGEIKAISVPTEVENLGSITPPKHISPDFTPDNSSIANNFQDQEIRLQSEIPALPELSATELPGDDDDDDLANMDPEEALLLYMQYTSQIDQDKDISGEVQCQQPHEMEDIEMIDWDAEIDSDPTDTHVKAARNFAQLKKTYHDKKASHTATEEDDIRFLAAEAAEMKRQGDLERRQRPIESEPSQQRLPAGYQYGDQHNADSLFIPETPDRPALTTGKKKQPKKVPKPQNRISAKETREAMAIGNGPSAARKRPSPSSRNQSTPRKKRDTKNNPRKAKTNNSNTKLSRLTNLGSLGRSNVVQDAQANADRPEIPTFSSKNKKKALQQLIASIPSTESGSYGSDSTIVIEATKKFRGHGVVRADGQGGWKLKGMRSSLYHHQLVGAGFLRDRENGSQRPFGGLVCDEMGFGKTIQMIANIVDGKADDGAAEKTTLIVAPSSLLNQWMMELEKHVAPGYLARIIRYHSGARLLSNNPVADLREYDIILTTYSEVQKSYPSCDPPKHLATEEAKNKWWAEFYQTNVGPLHRIKYLRIVLDEAHQIKNHTSKTSIAVRALTATFRWAITGTPILNYIEELYPYFSFLKVPHTGDFGTFVHNYCHNRKSKTLVNMSRIHNILRAIMLRRTHADTMFNLPILKLPGISHETRKVKFNDVERAIYNTVKRRCIQDINEIHRAGQLTGSQLTRGYSNILAMIQILRMLCAHVLLCQSALTRLFNTRDVEMLWRLAENEDQANPTDSGQRGIVSLLHKILLSKSTSLNSASNGSNSEEEEEDLNWIETARIPLSTKLRATKAAILNWRQKHPNEKILIYTQFLNMVRLLGKLCAIEGWNYVQFTGKMSLPAREKAINRFTEDEDTYIMICSLKAGGVGLNLARASKVIILDLWFNSSIEQQAYCRAFRIGQERPVEVIRFVIDDSIDDDLISMQNRKNVEIQAAIGSESHNGRATIRQLLGLFGEVVDEESGQNEFILVEDDCEHDDDPGVDIGDRLPPRPF